MVPVKIQQFPSKHLKRVLQQDGESPTCLKVNVSAVSGNFFENTMMLTSLRAGENSARHDESLIDGIRIRNVRKSD